MTLQQKWFSLLASQPSDYIAGRYLKLDYIESHGKEYIDTLYDNTLGWAIEYKIALSNDMSSWRSVSGTNAQSGGGECLAFYHRPTSGANQIDLYNGGVIDTVDYVYNIGVPTKFYFGVFTNRSVISVDDTVLLDKETSATHRAVGNVYFLYCSGYLYKSPIPCKVYYCKLYDNNSVLVRNFQPVYDTQTHQCGLYDLINNVFYGNQSGQGFFDGGYKGGKIIEYIESSGTQYIDTLTSLNQDSGLYAKFQSSSTSWADNAVIGSWNNNFMCIIYLGVWGGGYRNLLAYGDNVNNYSYYYPWGNYQTTNINEFYLNYNNDKKARLNNETYDMTSFTGSCPDNALIFAYNWEGEVVINSFAAKVFAAKITSNENTIKHFIPYINSNNVAGMYDLITKQFFANSGTGTFITPTY